MTSSTWMDLTKRSLMTASQVKSGKLFLKRAHLKTVSVKNLIRVKVPITQDRCVSSAMICKRSMCT